MAIQMYRIPLFSCTSDQHSSGVLGMAGEIFPTHLVYDQVPQRHGNGEVVGQTLYQRLHVQEDGDCKDEANEN